MENFWFLWLWVGWVGFWLMRFWQVNLHNKDSETKMYVFTYGTVLFSPIASLLGFGLFIVGMTLALMSIEWKKVLPMDKIMTFLETPIIKDKDRT